MPRDFNEEIVCSYYELKGYFVRMNVPYRPTEGRKDLSDIDIVAIDPLDDAKCIVCEVKGWHTERLTMSYWKDWPLLNFVSGPATSAVRELVGNRTLHHVLVVPPVSARQRQEVEAYAADHEVELLEWPRLLEELLSLIQVRQNARNQTDHVLRVLLNYGLLSRV